MELADDTLHSVIALVRQHTGIAMNEHKRVLLQGRLLPRMRALGLASYRDYVARVAAGGPEVEAFVNMVTTNDSAFFRTPAVWRWLESSFLDAWRNNADGGVLRIWSAAAATGEEAYSLAMLCAELRERHPNFRYAIHATDIASEALAQARSGSYGGRSAERFQAARPALFAKYMAPGAAAGEYVVTPALRECVTFAEHNLLGPAPMRGHFDLVMLRNVLIYFDEATQERALRQVRVAMRSRGRLVLGEQETISRIATPFEFEQHHVYRIAGEGA
ncbi:protein-glutamate O-methyltransferase CheR [uncultured Massilia sp.]|uniref:CheR family methyltransferase n=1 Tax=uncultured Massilia sp. TaxID=169973 RepID=UPI00258DB9FF|nr:protein-glutamate O-methyltransferase CheR [uncultured Massilia sp.]